ncbi:GyrI-like domain-containing protein [Paenibacillus cremeus]|uniref:AraC family transcriptional regulator n=1 Tax=Paenibacillus cremeus TaxID=2163881 RepID=A0A559KBB7_9BACL|nr:GyrI-like domain-containing protein [Paenibacillus cremeus]TVY09428.1 AraC family transcriptional regulator [Paenibacillus cremeus]
MDYQIVEKASFTVAGKGIQVSTQAGENVRVIPAFWDTYASDGTVAKLQAIGMKPELLGICMNMDCAAGQFTYLIAAEVGEGDAGGDAGLVTASIPAATWAVFTSVGPMPGAIQKVWEHIFQTWLPTSGYKHAGGPELELYPAGDVSAADYRCEVWIPVVKP